MPVKDLGRLTSSALTETFSFKMGHMLFFVSLLFFSNIRNYLSPFYAPMTIVRGRYVLPLYACPSVCPFLIKSLYNQLPDSFIAINLKLHNCCRYIEDVHLPFWSGKIVFDKNTAFSNLEKFRVMANTR